MTVQLHKRDIRAIRRETTATGRLGKFGDQPGRAVCRQPTDIRVRPISDSQRCSGVDTPTAVVFQIPDNCTLPLCVVGLP